jgi:hypothetical protein
MSRKQFGFFVSETEADFKTQIAGFGEAFTSSQIRRADMCI